MKKTVLSGVLFLIILSFFSQNAFAGAWTVPKNKLWGEWYLKWHWARQDFDDERSGDDKNNDGRSWGWVMEPKLEYGVTDWLTLLCGLEYKEAKYKEYDRPDEWGPFRRKNNDVTSLKLGGRLRFIEKPVVLSAQMKAFIYTHYGNFNGDDPAYRNQPSIGDGDDALEFRLLAGKRFKLPVGKDKSLVKCYVGAESGIRFRNRDVANDIPFLLEGGFWPNDRVLIKSEIDGYIAMDGTGIEKDYAVARIGPVFQILASDSITRQKNQFNLGVFYGYTFWGRNTSKDHEITFKVQFEI